MRYLVLCLAFIFASHAGFGQAAPGGQSSTTGSPSSNGLPESFNTYVISVTDGNWFESEREGSHVSVRLYGILCPDRKTAVGAAAAQDLGRLVYGKSVHVKRVGYSVYGGVFGLVTVDDFVNGQKKTTQVNESMISRGWAVAKDYLDLPDINNNYKQLESTARLQGIGIWFKPGASVQPGK